MSEQQAVSVIPDDVLRDERRFSRLRERLREEACGWGRSKRDKALKARYWNAPESAYLSLQVRWDYRPLANRLNWEASEYDLCACSLYECASWQLFSHLSDSRNLLFDGIFQRTTENIFLRVVGHWEIGAPLSPPILTLRKDGKLAKIDGFHRLAVAFAAKVSRIPFWAVLPVRLPGVSQISPTSYSAQQHGRGIWGRI